MIHSSLSTFSVSPQPNTTASLLIRILQTPDLVHQIQSLPAPTLLRLVNKVGLEDSSELLALATTAQLIRMVDDDLWKQTKTSKGREAFDSDRLSVWLRALEEMGSALAAEKLSEMDEDFLCHAFGQYLHCLELEAMQFMLVNVQGDSWQDARLESLLESQNSQEIGEYLVLARATAPWDTLQSLLLALDEVDTSLCGRLLQRLCLATEEKSEKEGGLFEVLSGEEMLESDAGFSRHQRRTGDGFVPAEDALAFMAWVKAVPLEELRNLKGRDPVSRAYFREYKGETFEKAVRSSTAQRKGSDTLLTLIGDLEGNEEAEVISPALPSLISGLGGEDESRVVMDLNFLAQVVMLTETRRAAPLRQSEAAELVVRVCEDGLRKVKAEPSVAPNMIQLFALGTRM